MNLVLSTLILSVCLVQFVLSQEEISDQCLGCICHASTGCNINTGCSEGGVCGPFLITWGFWFDAGKLVIRGTDPESLDSYSKCTTDIYCASETVRGYIHKYKKDCNGDGKVDCEDYARIHKLGPGNCGDPSFKDQKYYKEFATCKAQTQAQ